MAGSLGDDVALMMLGRRTGETDEALEPPSTWEAGLILLMLSRPTDLSRKRWE
jgi:hypothetical protein